MNIKEIESILSKTYYSPDNPAAFSTPHRLFTYLRSKGFEIGKN